MQRKARDKFSLTFKNNEVEQSIKDYLNTKFNPTNYIKELIYNDMLGQGSVLVQNKVSDEDMKKLLEDFKNQKLVVTDNMVENKIEVGPVAAQKDEPNKFAFDPLMKPF